MTPIPDHTALILIDVQEGMDDPRLGRRNNPQAESNMARLLADWRAAGRPIFHVQHMSTEPNSPLRPELPGNAIKRIVAPEGDEPLIQKTVNSAFIGTDLEDRLRRAGIDTVVIVGLVTNHCVSTSVRMAGNLGFNTFVVEDATATFDRVGPDGIHYPAETLHTVELASLHGEFATVVSTDRLLER
jgi:nicotinamidase-related amidase